MIGTFLMAYTAAQHFVRQGYGKIINLSTSVHNFFRERQSPYGVTKAAIDASTYIWSQDLKDKGVDVNACCRAAPAIRIPTARPRPGRTLLPIDVMNPVLVWLCSARSDGLTGGRYNGSLWDASLDPDAAAAGCREEPSIRARGLETKNPADAVRRGFRERAGRYSAAEAEPFWYLFAMSLSTASSTAVPL